MKNTEAWVKLLYTYGPFAILILLVFVTERKSRTAMKEATKRDEKALTAVYVLNWVAIFGLVTYSVYAWKQINIDRKPTIRGTIENLSNLQTLGTTSADLYLRKIPKSNSYSDYEWLLINKDKRWDDGAKIRFTIQAPKPDSKDDDLFEYELPIQSDFYDNGVLLRHKQGKLFLDHAGEEKELQGGVLPGNTQPLSARVEPSWELFPIAYAATVQKSFSTYDLSIGLESPDAIIRRKARAELANQDQAVALPWIDGVLKDQKSSSLLRIGVMFALNNMPNVRGESLKPSTIAAIQSALNDSDQTLRNEALSLAKRYNLVPATVYEHINYSGKSQGFGLGRYSANKSQFGSLSNDSASSVRIARGFKIRLCDSEGNGSGGGRCEEKGEGSYPLRAGIFGGVGDKVSFIEVIKR